MKPLIMGAGPLHVLCLGAHPDDIEIGCGGTLLTLAERPDTTLFSLMLSGSGGRPDEARGAAEAFFPGAVVEFADFPDGRLPAHWAEVKQFVEDYAARTPKPDLVFVPRTDDAHQDHRLLGTLASTVWRDSLILHYEIPKWDGDLSRPDHYVGLTREQGQRKVELLNQHYTSQLARDWWDDEYFLGFMRMRGVECRHRYAEAFHGPKVLLAFGQETTS